MRDRIAELEAQLLAEREKLLDAEATIKSQDELIDALSQKDGK